MLKKIYLFVITLMFLQPVLAFNMSTSVETITVPQTGIKNIDISFYSEMADNLRFTLDGRPWMRLSDSRLELAGKETKNITLYATPDENVVEGIKYKLKFYAESITTGQIEEKTLYVYVVKEKVVLIEKVIVTGSLQPTGTITLQTYLKNFGDASVTNAVLTGSVEGLTGFSHNIDTIDPGQTIIVEDDIEIPAGAKAGHYKIIEELTYPEHVAHYTQIFTIAERAIVDKKEENVLVFLGLGKKITLTNNGNKHVDYEHSEEIDNLFFSGSPTQKNGYLYTWVVSLNPGQTKVIYYETNYIPLLIGIVVLVVLVWVYMKKIRSVRIRKFIMQEKKIKHGAEFTVGVEISNKLGKRSEDVVVKDFVPPIFDIRVESGPKPKRRKSGMGTELIWNIDVMHKNDERLFSYKLIPLFGVSGRVSLPTARVSYHKGLLKMEAKSMPVSIGVAKKRR
jgi:hypothetical protein